MLVNGAGDKIARVVWKAKNFNFEILANSFLNLNPGFFSFANNGKASSRPGVID